MTPLELTPDQLDAIRFESIAVNRKTGWRVERDDLFQEGALAVLRLIAEGRDVNQALARITARNAMLDLARDAMKWNRVDALNAETLEQSTFRRPPDVAAILDLREALDRIKATAKTSTYDHLDAEPKQLAGGLGIARQAAASRLHHARRRVREALGDGYAHMSHPPIIKHSKWVTHDAKRRAARQSRRETAQLSDPKP